MQALARGGAGHFIIFFGAAFVWIWDAWMEIMVLSFCLLRICLFIPWFLFVSKFEIIKWRKHFLELLFCCVVSFVVELKLGWGLSGMDEGGKRRILTNCAYKFSSMTPPRTCVISNLAHI
jgi:hypothetical protein